MDIHRVNPFLEPISAQRSDIGYVIRDGVEDPHDMNFRDHYEVKLLKLEISQKGWVIIKGERQKDDHADDQLNKYIDHHHIGPIIWAIKDGTWKVISWEEASGDRREIKASKPRTEAGYDLSSLECYHLKGHYSDKWAVTVVKPTADNKGKNGEQTIQMNGSDIFFCSSSLPHSGPVVDPRCVADDQGVLHLRYVHFSTDLVFLPPSYEAIEACYPASVRFLVPRPSELAKLQKEEVVEEEEEEEEEQ